MNGELADAAQLFIGKEEFFLAAGTFPVAETGLAGDLAQLRFRDAQQQCGAALVHVFRFGDFHHSPSSREKSHGVLLDAEDHGLVDVNVPTVADAHAQFAKRHLEHHCLTNPRLESDFHRPPSKPVSRDVGFRCGKQNEGSTRGRQWYREGSRIGEKYCPGGLSPKRTGFYASTSVLL